VLQKRKGPKRRSNPGKLVWFAAFSGFLLILPTTERVNAHSWYPLRCCGGYDCRKVDKIDVLPDGSMIMHAGAVEVVVPRNFIREPSQDSDAHVCAIPLVPGTYVPVCVFLPGTT
jgi:hypothetical protein